MCCGGAADVCTVADDVVMPPGCDRDVCAMLVIVDVGELGRVVVALVALGDTGADDDADDHASRSMMPRGMWCSSASRALSVSASNCANVSMSNRLFGDNEPCCADDVALDGTLTRVAGVAGESVSSITALVVDATTGGGGGGDGGDDTAMLGMMCGGGVRTAPPTRALVLRGNVVDDVVVVCVCCVARRRRRAGARGRDRALRCCATNADTDASAMSLSITPNAPLGSATVGLPMRDKRS
jgi:hypothetical protein